MSTFVLKIIALTCMIIDHIGAVFPMDFPVMFRVIGRVAFPIYVYLIAEGCRHTRSMPKYLLRLGFFALLSQIPFDLAFNQNSYGSLHVDFLKDTNVFYTLFLGALCVYAYQKLRDTGRFYAQLLTLPTVLAAMVLAEWLQTDYGGFGVAFIFLMYIASHKIARLVVMAAGCCYEFYPVIFGALSRLMYGTGLLQHYAPYLTATGLMMLGACLVSVPLVAFHNGRRGPGLKWFFYAAYPVHLLILGVIWLVS